MAPWKDATVMTSKVVSLLCGQYETLRLRRNLGHQRAIAIGLAHVQQATGCDAVVVMDSDGEDTPEGVAQLLRAYSDAHGATAFLRSGAAVGIFCVWSLYHLYKFLHRCLTGIVYG